MQTVRDSVRIAKVTATKRADEVILKVRKREVHGVSVEGGTVKDSG
jgi:hypothetical protein